MTDHPVTPDALAALRTLLGGDFPAWEAWRGVSGILHARRRRTSPPAVYRGDTPGSVARQIRQWEEAHQS